MRLYNAILMEELLLATGCTEPIVTAYCAAVLRETLRAVPTHVAAFISRNINKNAKSVIVPNTAGIKGIHAAIAAGLIVGDVSRKLQ